VIEKCLEHNSPEIKEAMVLEILSADSFYEFLLDQYGNYVIQKSLQVALEPHFSNFIEKLKPDLDRLRHSNEFGIKIYNRLVKQYPQLSCDHLVKGKSQYSAKKGKEASGKGDRHRSGDGSSGNLSKGSKNNGGSQGGQMSNQNIKKKDKPQGMKQGLGSGYSEYEH
jgi:hypothetical protein